VGSNNSGKSNIVRALSIFFDPYYQIKDDDFHAGVNSQTVILKAAISINGRRERRVVNEYHITRLMTNDNKFKLERRQHIGEKAKYFDLGKTGKKRLIEGQELFDMGRFFRKYFLFMDVLSSEYLDFEHLEKVKSHVHVNKSSKYIKDKFCREIEPAFQHIDAYIKPIFKTTLSKFSKHLGIPADGFSFRVIPDHAQMFSNIRLQINQGDLDSSLINKGQGFKNISAFILSGVFDTASKHVVVLEEPEIHLHPSLIRRLVNSIISTASSTASTKQFFITTHNSNVIDSIDPKFLKRVVMNDGKTCLISPKLKEDMIYDFYKHIYGNHSECLLSRRVVIAEGVSEVRSLPGLSEKVTLKNGRLASLDINEIQIVQVEGSNFHGPIRFLEEFGIDWLILGDEDKWPKEYLTTIKKLNMNIKHPRMYRFLQAKIGEARKPTEEIRRVLYEYFRIICLPKKYENLLVTDENVDKISQLLKTYFKQRYNTIRKQYKLLSELDICRKVMIKDKPQWAIILAKKLDTSAIPEGIKKLLDLIVNRPKTGSL
jgi:predicted ATP-dependent endonuclease of OLD family